MSLKFGDIITFAGVYVAPRWWQFWRWGSKPPVLKQFVVVSVDKFTDLDEHDG